MTCVEDMCQAHPPACARVHVRARKRHNNKLSYNKGEKYSGYADGRTLRPLPWPDGARETMTDATRPRAASRAALRDSGCADGRILSPLALASTEALLLG